MNDEKKLTLKKLEERTDKSNQMKKRFEMILSDLKQAFMRDFTEREACHAADISHDTFYRWIRESDEFAEEIEKAKSWLFRKAKQNIVNAVEAGDPDNSKWLLGRRQKDIYSERQEQTGKDGGKIEHDVNISNFTKEQLETLTDDEKIRVAGKQVNKQV